jgi:hypothetical protein
MSIALENVRQDLRTRAENDPQMSAAWAILPIISIIGGILIGVSFAVFLSTLPLTTGTTSTTAEVTLVGLFFALFLLYVAIFIIAIIFTMLLFKLVKRRNTHFTRQTFVFEDLIGAAKQLAAKKGVDVSLHVNYLERNVREAKFDELEKNATLFAILSIIPIFNYYVYYFLMKDFFRHERREDLYVAGLTNLLATLGIPMNLPQRTAPVPDRSFAVYFIVSLITGSIFSVYWVYVLVTDPNNHFRQQAWIEDTIMAQLSPALA